MPRDFTEVVGTLAAGTASGTHVRKRLALRAPISVYAARRIQDGLEALLLEAPANALETIHDWPESAGFEVSRTTVDGSGTSVRLTLQLTAVEFRTVFHALCGDLSGVLEAASDEAESIRAFQYRLVIWQRFLRRHGAAGLSSEAQCGLYGELRTLLRIMLPQLPDVASVAAWRGHTGANQDFHLPGRALEVKTTRQVIPDRVHISNAQQLDGSGLTHLVLLLVHVHENDSAGEGLNELVDTLRERLDPSSRDLFELGLIEVGYLAAHRERYASLYEFKRQMFFEVTDGFPRILIQELHPGIKSLKYQVTVDSCLPFEISEERVALIIEGSE